MNTLFANLGCLLVYRLKKPTQSCHLANIIHEALLRYLLSTIALASLLSTVYPVGDAAVNNAVLHTYTQGSRLRHN